MYKPDCTAHRNLADDYRLISRFLPESNMLHVKASKSYRASLTQPVDRFAKWADGLGSCGAEMYYDAVTEWRRSFQFPLMTS